MYYYLSIKQALENGSRVVINVKNYSPEALEDLVISSRQSGGLLSLTGCGKMSTGQVVELSKLGGKNVVFDFS